MLTRESDHLAVLRQNLARAVFRLINPTSDLAFVFNEIGFYLSVGVDPLRPRVYQALDCNRVPRNGEVEIVSGPSHSALRQYDPACLIFHKRMDLGFMQLLAHGVFLNGGTRERLFLRIKHKSGGGNFVNRFAFHS